MIPNFVNIQEALGQSGNDIYYQVQSFRYKNRFYNVRKGWALEIRIVSQWLQDFSLPQYIAGADYPDEVLVVPICYDTGDDYQVMTEDEIVQQLNTNLRQILWSRRSQSTYDNFESEMNFLNVLSNIQFQYDTLTGKFAAVLYGGETNLSPLKPIYGIPEMTSQNLQDWMLAGILLTVQTYRKMSIEDQAYLATIMGFVDTYDDYKLAIFGTSTGDITTMKEADDGNEDETNFPQLYIDRNLMNDYDVPQFYWQVAFSFTDCSLIYAKRQLVEFKDYMKLTPPFVTKFAPRQMTSSTINQIQIHSSLLSNIWDWRGIKTNVIETIPVLDRSVNENIQVYEPASSSTRICNVRDSINSLQTFNIYFTDQFEQLITFTEPYELKIAIFFK